MDHIHLLDVILTSDDDSEDDWQEYELIFGSDCRCHYRLRIPRVQYFIETVVHAYNAEDFRRAFRLTRTTFEYVLLLVGPHLRSPNPRGSHQIPPEKQLFITLWYLGTPDSYRSVTTKFDCGQATAWRSVRRVVETLYYYRNFYVRWDTEQEMRRTAAMILRDYGLPGVNGMVDGTHIEVPVPVIDAVAWFNRKGFASIQTQVVCNYRLRFMHCFAGFPGSVHDMRVFRYSGLQQMCTPEFFPDGMHLIADSAYTLQENVITVFRDNGYLTVMERFFNRCLSGPRAAVERSIALLKVRWRILLNQCPIKRQDLQPYIVFACCILHNICLLNEHELVLPGIPVDEDLEDEPIPMFPTRRQQQIGAQKRMNLVNVVNRI